MKTLLSIITAFALLVVFSMPAMASNDNDYDIYAEANDNSEGSAVAQQGSRATATYMGDDNSVAMAELEQVNMIHYHTANLIHGYSGAITLTESIDMLTGVANVNLNTGAMNNQAIQNTFVATVDVD